VTIKTSKVLEFLVNLMPVYIQYIHSIYCVIQCTMKTLLVRCSPIRFSGTKMNKKESKIKPQLWVIFISFYRKTAMANTW